MWVVSPLIPPPSHDILQLLLSNTFSSLNLGIPCAMDVALLSGFTEHRETLDLGRRKSETAVVGGESLREEGELKGIRNLH